MADRSRRPEDNVAQDELAAGLKAVSRQFSAELADVREQTAEEAAKTRAVIRQEAAKPVRASKKARAEATQAEQAAIEESSLRQARAQEAATKAAAERLRIEEEEAYILRANSETLLGQQHRLERVRGELARTYQPPSTAVAVRAQPLIADAEVARLRAELARQPIYGVGRPGQLQIAGRAPGAAIQPVGLGLPSAGGPIQVGRAVPPGMQVTTGYGAVEGDVAAKKAAAAAEREAEAGRREAEASIRRQEAAQTALNEDTTAFARIQANANRELQYEARALSLASNAAQKHGYLTSETIGYMQKGQVSARQFGEEILGTISKFAGWTAAAGATYGVLGALGQLAKGAIDAASGVGLVQRVMNNVDTSKLQQSFRDLSAQFNVPISDAVQAVYGSAKVFQDQSDAVQGATAALYAMKVGELDAGTATQTLNAIVNGFGLTASDTIDVLDTINAVQNKFGGNVGQISLGVAKAAGSFKLAGGDYRELIALIETGTKVTGTSGENVATAISRSASRILTPQGGAALQAVGITPGGGIMDVLKQAFAIAQKASPEEVNALARAIVPQGGQFARLIVPILENRRLFEQILGASTPEKTQGSAARELQHALGQVNEQISAIGHGLERLGSAFAQAGGLNGVGILIKALNQTLTTVTNIVEVVGKIPGIQIITPFLELQAVLRGLRFFNVGNALPAAAPGSLRGRLQGFVTEDPDRTAYKIMRKDLADEQGTLANDANAAIRRSRTAQRQLVAVSRASYEAINSGLLDEDQILAEREKIAAELRKAAAASRASREAAEQVTLAQERGTVLLRAQRAGVAPSRAGALAGMGVLSGTLERGRGGAPVEFAETSVPPPGFAMSVAGIQGVAASAAELGGTAETTAVSLSAVRQQLKAAEVAEGERVAAAKATGEALVATEEATGAERIRAAQGLAEVQAAMAEGRLGANLMPGSTRFGALQTLRAQGQDLAGRGFAGARGLASRGLGGLGAAATFAGLRGRGPGGPDEPGAFQVGPLETALAVGATVKTVADFYDTYESHINDLAKALGTGDGNLKKAIAAGQAVQKQFDVSLGTLGDDLLHMRLGDAFAKVATNIGLTVVSALGGPDPRKTAADMTRAAKSESASLKLAQGVQLSDADRQSLVDAQMAQLGISPLSDAYYTGPIRQQVDAQINKTIAESRQRARRGRQVDLTQAQINALVQQQLGGAFTPQDQLRVLQHASGWYEQESLATHTPGDSKLQAQKAAEQADLASRTERILAQIGNVAAIGKLLDDGDLKISDALANLQADISLSGLNPKDTRIAAKVASKAISDLGAAQQAGTSIAPALKEYNDAVQTILAPAQADYNNALAIARTPAQTRAAQNRFLAQNRAQYIGVPRDQLRAAEAGIADAQRTLREPGQTTQVRDQAKAALRDYTRRADNAKKLLKNGYEAFDVIAAGIDKTRMADDFALIDAKATYQASKTDDPAAKARIQLRAVNQKLKRMADAGLKGTADWFNLLAQQQDDQKSIMDNWLQHYDDVAGVADSAAEIGATPRQALNIEIARAQNRLAAMRAHHAPQHDIAQQRIDLNKLYGQMADMNRQDAQALVDATAAYQESGTEDPVKIAEMELARVRKDASYARTPVEKIQAATEVRNKQTALRNAKVQDSLDTIQFNLDMERIDKSTAAAEITALAHRRGISKALRRQLLTEAHSLLQDSQSEDITLGNIRLPSTYEVFRAVKEGQRAAGKSTSSGNVHATTNATINVVVANRKDVGAVSDAIDNVLTTHVRSTLRAKGVIGG